MEEQIARDLRRQRLRVRAYGLAAAVYIAVPLFLVVARWLDPGALTTVDAGVLVGTAVVAVLAVIVVLRGAYVFGRRREYELAYLLTRPSPWACD